MDSFSSSFTVLILYIVFWVCGCLCIFSFSLFSWVLLYVILHSLAAYPIKRIPSFSLTSPCVLSLWFCILFLLVPDRGDSLAPDTSFTSAPRLCSINLWPERFFATNLNGQYADECLLHVKPSWWSWEYSHNTNAYFHSTLSSVLRPSRCCEIIHIAKQGRVHDCAGSPGPALWYHHW